MKFKKALFGLASAAAVVAPVAMAVACGSSASSRTAMGVPIKTSANADLWFVADGGHVTDKSFNESGLAGVAKYGNDNAVAYNYVEPTESNQITNAYQTAVSKGAKVIVGSGFYHFDQAKAFFTSAKSQTFIGIDTDFSADTTNTNKASIIFPTEQAGYLAGIYAVQYIVENKANLVADTVGGKSVYKTAAFGGGKMLPVTSWMDGFVKGVKDASDSLSDTNISVEMVYANNSQTPTAKDFTDDSFSPTSTQVKPIVEDYLSQGADVIFPVAGPQIKLAIDTIRDKRSKAVTIGVDGDQVKALGSGYSDKIIGSALKDLQNETIKALTSFYADPTQFNHDYITSAHAGKVGFVGGKNSTNFGIADWSKTVFKATNKIETDLSHVTLDPSKGYASVKKATHQ